MDQADYFAIAQMDFFGKENYVWFIAELGDSLYSFTKSSYTFLLLLFDGKASCGCCCDAVKFNFKIWITQSVNAI